MSTCDKLTGTLTLGATMSGGLLVAKGDKGDSIPSGGIAGQFLKKKSSTDYDYVWSTLETITNAEIDTIIMS